MKKLLILGCLVLAACDASKNYKVEHVDKAVIISHIYTKHFGQAFGPTTVYTLYGKAPNGDKEGTASTSDHKYFFSIKEMVDAHPDLDDPKVKQAERRQNGTIKSYLGVK